MSISYSLYIDEEEGKRLVEKTNDGQPFQFISGFGVALDVFEQQLTPLEKGASFDFALTKDQAYGDYNDELLMERIMKAVNKNLSNSDFNVDMLTQEVGISRAQLHRKMKEMTGISTSEFIRNIRLEQAARLLREQKINVTQVSYTVGFSNLAHFSTIFRKHFGIAPSEYAEKNGESEA